MCDVDGIAGDSCCTSRESDADAISVVGTDIKKK